MPRLAARIAWSPARLSSVQPRRAREPHEVVDTHRVALRPRRRVIRQDFRSGSLRCAPAMHNGRKRVPGSSEA